MGQPSPPEQWTPCESGQLSALARQLKPPAKAGGLRAGSAAVAACAAAIVLGGLYYNRPAPEAPPVLTPQVTPARLRCPAVLEHLPQYAQGGCPHLLTEQISEHLERCAYCRRVYEKLRAKHADVGNQQGFQRAQHPASQRLSAAEMAVQVF